MNYLLYCGESSVTGKALLDALKEQGVKINGGTKGPGESKVDVLIRWGAPAKVGKKPTKVLNRADAIMAASNKRQALETMRAAGVRVPVIFSRKEPHKAQAEFNIPHDAFPVLGRKDKHVGANDIILCLQAKDLERAIAAGCTHFSRYIPTKAEYRVHVFGDQIIKVSQKVLTNPEQAQQPWIRNLGAGYTFRQSEERLSGAARGMATDAVHSLGLTFGAVDIIVGDDGNPYILEVNTAPGLQTDTSLDAYLEQFKTAIERRN